MSMLQRGMAPGTVVPTAKRRAATKSIPSPSANIDGVDGPLAFDNAVSEEAAQEKHIVSPVAGNANILLVPAIEAGNRLAKQLTYTGETVYVDGGYHILG